MAIITQATQKLLKLNKRIKAVCGGTSASKTYSILLILIDKAQSNDNLTIDIMSESYPHLEGGAIKDFKGIMQEQGYWKDNRWNETKHFYTFETGSIIKFISVDKLGKAHGPRRDILFVNEANNISYNIFDQLMIRTSGDIWIDWNPTAEFWYYTQIKDRVDHDFITLTYIDNEALAEPVKEAIERHKDNKRWWKVYGLGELGESEERVYTGWREIEDIPHEARLWRRGMDFGYTNDPTVLIDIYEYQGGYILDETIYSTGLQNKSIYDLVMNLPEPKTLIIADSADPKSIDELKIYGLNVMGAKKGQGSVYQGIQFVQGLKISITKRSVKTIKAYRNYTFYVDKDGKVTNDPDDAVHEWSNPMDATRYGFNGVITGGNKAEIECSILNNIRNQSNPIYIR